MTLAGLSGSISRVDSYKKLLNQNGFVEHDHKEHFGYVIPYVYYAFRQTKKLDGFPLWEYVSLVYYDGKMVEAVYEAYINKKNSYAGKGKDEKLANSPYSKFQKSGQKMVDGNIFRSLVDLENKLK